MKTSNQNTLFFKYRKDTAHTVSRETVLKMAEKLGLSSESEVIFYALSQLADKLLPKNSADKN